jgi:hypothetical protein
LGARWVVRHMQRNGTSCLGATTHVVELEPHQSLHQGCTSSRMRDAIFRLLMSINTLRQGLKSSCTRGGASGIEPELGSSKWPAPDFPSV